MAAAGLPDPPAPWLQTLNWALQQEPFETLAHTLYWSAYWICYTPLAVLCLQLQLLYRLALWLFQRRNTVHHTPSPHKAIVITGCDSGFGQELALQAGRAGFTVFASSLDETSFFAFRKVPTIRHVTVDVTKAAQVEALVEAVEAWLKEDPEQRVLHAVVNNAGILAGGLVDWMDLGAYETAMEVNFFGLLRVCQAFIPLLRAQALARRHVGASRILNLTSLAGTVPTMPGLSAYAASKRAAQAVSEALRYELAGFGIQVGTWCPSFHDTDMVVGASALMDGQWDKLSAHKKKDIYGEDYFRQLRYSFVEIPQTIRWDRPEAVQLLYQALVAEHVPRAYLIGSDACYTTPLMRMVPPWVLDWVFQSQCPTPVCLRS